MSRAITLGNGNVLIGLDTKGQVRDFFYPQVGEVNHVSGASGSFVHRLGVFCDGRLTWLDDAGWQVTVSMCDKTALGKLQAVHEEFGITLSSTDAVHNEENIFLRHFVITNIGTETKTVKLFISQQFRIDESRRGDTAFYDPRVGAIVHYKGSVTLLINAAIDGKQFSEYNIGLFGIEGKEGTYFDAYDGVLAKNPIEHGSVDSILAVETTLAPEATSLVDYWIVCASDMAEAHRLNMHVINEAPERLTASTQSYWDAWLNKETRDYADLSPALQVLHHRSLFIMRIHADNRGGIIASSDTDILHHGRDTYAYVWPRDAAIVASALELSGYDDVARRYFSFIAKQLQPGGYLMHKYRTDGTLGSSWHTWMIGREAILPIQEDETALTLVSLWQHYERQHDIEYIESLYNPFIEKAGDFLASYIEPVTGLPQASFDLWEEKYGTSTYTASATYAGLVAATKFAHLLGKEANARTYEAVAERMRKAIIDVLYRPDIKMFAKHVIHTKDGELEFDDTIDTSSFYGVVAFGVCDVHDPLIKKAAETVYARLQVQGESAGFVRYENDNYYRQAASPNPWVITTLWMAQYEIKRAKKVADLKAAKDILEWTVSHATVSGVLAEQMHPDTRAHLSTAPLIWSHAEYVLTIDAYVKRYKELLG